MEDKSLVKPILQALEYFKESKEELKYFYRIIDKFCACWFGKVINIHKLNNIELLLMHDLLGEYIRFEENNKRIALWLLAINRVCHNYTSNLTEALNDISKINKENQGVDSSLIEPIIRQLDILDKLHKSAGKNDLGQSDIISNFIQWVLVYSTLIYPSLENKMDFYDKTTINAMNFILLEFIKQRSNDRRMAYLIMGIIESCRQYNIQTQSISSDLIKADYDEDAVIPGQEESLVAEILKNLKNQNSKSDTYIETAPATYVKKKILDLADELNRSEERLVSIFNKYIYELTQKFITYEEENQIFFLQNLSQIKSVKIKSEISSNIEKLINNLPSKSIKWLNKNMKELDMNKNNYPQKIINDFKQKKPLSKFNFFKPFLMLLITKALGVALK